MKYDLNEYGSKGVVVTMVGETQNILCYKDNNDLWDLISKCKTKDNELDVYDFTDRFIYFIYNDEDINDLKQELGGK